MSSTLPDAVVDMSALYDADDEEDTKAEEKKAPPKAKPKPKPKAKEEKKQKPAAAEEKKKAKPKEEKKQKPAAADEKKSTTTKKKRHADESEIADLDVRAMVTCLKKARDEEFSHHIGSATQEAATMLSAVSWLLAEEATVLAAM